MLCPLIVHVYSCFPDNEDFVVLLYSVMLVESDDCEQVNGPDPPLHCTGKLSGSVHCPSPILSHQPVHSGVGCQQSEQSH